MTTNPKTLASGTKALVAAKTRSEETRRKETRRGGVAALAVNVPAITRAALGSRGFAEAGLLTHWPEIAGANLARGCQPDKLRFSKGERRDGTLILRCIGALALELQHQAPHLLERINGYFGYRAVARLQIVQGTLRRRRPRPKPPLPALSAADAAVTETTIARVQDGDLKDVLRRLGHAIHRRNKRAENR
ncbi:DUF721 domain-containing protein [Dongia soli]|uniref:DciA family protein n=1 Tax=Dongia soli TaxID=600628 RepID=A0ABU5ECK7_9PROT|nr:DciA family protein [Dongia soli]MDY0883943.1 DciA family protein [Dongia soli]